MKPFLGSIIFLLFIAIVSNADAQNIGTSIFSWNPPTQRENGEALKPEEIGGFIVAYRKEGDNAFFEVKVDARKTELPITVPFGNYEVRALCYDTNGLYSNWSSVKKFTVKTAPKKPLYPSVRVVQ